MPRVAPDKKKLRPKSLKLPVAAVTVLVVVGFVAVWIALPTLLKTNSKTQTGANNAQETVDEEAATKTVTDANNNDLVQAQKQVNELIAAKASSDVLSNAYVDLGNAYLNLDQPDKAIVEQQRALTISNENIGAITGLALAYQALNKFQLAIDQYNLAIVIAKKQPDTYSQLAIDKWNASIASLKAKL